MQRTVSAWLCGGVCPVRGAGLGDAGRHVAGRQEPRVVGVDHGGEGRDLRRARPAGRAGRRQAGRRPGALALLQQPQAHDVAQVADRAVDAELVGEPGGAALLGEHRLLELHADQRPRAARDVGEPVGRRRGRRRPPTRCRATRRRSRAPGRSARSRRGRRRAAPPAGRPAGAAAGTGSAASPRPVDQRPGPLARRRVEQAGRRGVGDLRADRAGEPVREQVRDQQQPCGPRPAAAVPRRAASWNTVLNGRCCSPLIRYSSSGPTTACTAATAVSCRASR